jgi:DME family drug/metabolite transporter
MNRNTGYWLVIFAAMLWGTTGTTQAFAPEEAKPFVIGTLRISIGGALLLLLAFLRGSLRTWRRLALWPTVISAVCIAAYQVFFFEGVARTGVAVGTIVGIGSVPIFGGLLGWGLRKERLEKRWHFATGLAIIGAILLLSTNGEFRVDPFGILLAIGAGGVYAIFVAVSKGMLESRSPDMAMAVIFSLGALFLLPALLTADLSWVLQPRGLAVTLHLGLFTAALAYFLFARGLRLVPVSTAATLTLAEPLTAGILGVAILGERLTPSAAAGIGLVFLGLVILSGNLESRNDV